MDTVILEERFCWESGSRPCTKECYLPHAIKRTTISLKDLEERQREAERDKDVPRQIICTALIILVVLFVIVIFI
jgi:hypothetical protein